MQKVEVTCPRSMICAVMTQKSLPAQSTCAHTHTEIDSHSDIQIHMPSDMHADIHRDTREHIPAYIHRYTQAQTLKDTNAHTAVPTSILFPSESFLRWLTHSQSPCFGAGPVHPGKPPGWTPCPGSQLCIGPHSQIPVPREEGAFSLSGKGGMTA